MSFLNIDNNLNVLSKYYDLRNVYNQSIYASRALKFFNNHPFAYDLIHCNYGKSLKEISLLLYQNNISNKGKPYSIATISILKEFLKDLESSKLNDKNHLTNNKALINNEI